MFVLLRLTGDQTFQWKALRLLARRSPQFFTNSATPAQELRVYLNNQLDKLAKQMPVGSCSFWRAHTINISPESLNWRPMLRQMWESMLPQTLCVW